MAESTNTPKGKPAMIGSGNEGAASSGDAVPSEEARCSRCGRPELADGRCAWCLLMANGSKVEGGDAVPAAVDPKAARRMGGFVEWLLDLILEYQEIRDGCEADSNTGPVYLKRYFVVKNDDPSRSAGVQHKPLFNLTWHRSGNGRQLYLHHILRSDADREMHDHPWGFLSIILWRGYVEETVRGLARKWPGMVLRRSPLHRHRLHLDRPAWSLVFTTGKQRTWGFWRDGAFIPWRSFIARKCGEVLSEKQSEID